MPVSNNKYSAFEGEEDAQREMILEALLDVVFPFITEEGSEARKEEVTTRQSVSKGYSEHDTETLHTMLQKCRESREKKASEYAFV